MDNIVEANTVFASGARREDEPSPMRERGAAGLGNIVQPADVSLTSRRLSKRSGYSESPLYHYSRIPPVNQQCGAQYVSALCAANRYEKQEVNHITRGGPFALSSRA